MENIIKAAVERGASDIHIKAGDVFRARIDGELKALTKQRLTPEQTKAIALRVIPTETDRGRIEEIRDYDCSWGAPGVGRFRVNILRQRSSFMIVMRVIPFEVPSLDKLHLPPVLGAIAEAERGLVLVSGPTGSGKTSTMAAILHHLNVTQARHVIALESPIEFLHRDVNASITQREVGVDTESWPVGLRAALRQDPDVILVGQVPDTETMDLAITAAETGYLVIAGMSSPTVLAAVDRVVAAFPTEDQDVARARLAASLHAIIAQRLLPRADGEGRCPAAEVLVATDDVRETIRNRKGAKRLMELMSEDDEHGMITFAQNVADLVGAGLVSEDTAKAVGGP